MEGKGLNLMKLYEDINPYEVFEVMNTPKDYNNKQLTVLTGVPFMGDTFVQYMIDLNIEEFVTKYLASDEGTYGTFTTRIKVLTEIMYELSMLYASKVYKRGKWLHSNSNCIPDIDNEITAIEFKLAEVREAMAKPSLPVHPKNYNKILDAAYEALGM